MSDSHPSDSAPAGARVPRPIKVFLVDDHDVVRRGVRELLESEGDIAVVGEASTAGDALVRAPAAQPDVAVLDRRCAARSRATGRR